MGIIERERALARELGADFERLIASEIAPASSSRATNTSNGVGAIVDAEVAGELFGVSTTSLRSEVVEEVLDESSAVRSDNAASQSVTDMLRQILVEGRERLTASDEFLIQNTHSIVGCYRWERCWRAQG